MNNNGSFHKIAGYIPFILIILAVIFQSLAIVSGKYAAITLGNHAIVSLIGNTFYVASLGFYILQAIVWQQVLIQHALSVAYLFMSSVNFIVLFCSVYLFKEGITMTNIIGILLISVGISLLVLKFEETR
jgi:multidrug transporter EmrE-like cation transporter